MNLKLPFFIPLLLVKHCPLTRVQAVRTLPLFFPKKSARSGAAASCSTNASACPIPTVSRHPTASSA